MTDLRDRIATVLRDNLAVSRFEADSMADAATKELRRRECAESYQSDTEKHLRDRIAQTLYRRYAPQLGMADNPWEDEHSLAQEMWREDADAVIAELEADYILVPKSYAIARAANQRRDCNPHPDAPHGFDRNASHAEDRYVCDCESWTPAKVDVTHVAPGEIRRMLTLEQRQALDGLTQWGNDTQPDSGDQGKQEVGAPTGE